jgi:hypothetical protein
VSRDATLCSQRSPDSLRFQSRAFVLEVCAQASLLKTKGDLGSAKEGAAPRNTKDCQNGVASLWNFEGKIICVAVRGRSMLNSQARPGSITG